MTAASSPLLICIATMCCNLLFANAFASTSTLQTTKHHNLLSSRHLSRHLNQSYNHNIASRHLSRHLDKPYNVLLQSTPFDLDMYDNFNTNDNDDNDPSISDDEEEVPPLAVPQDTKLTIGLTKYSHDTTLCAADSSTGQVLFALSKERISRNKHDGGDTASLVELCLETLDLDIDNINKVVMNNHHHRILPMEDNVEHMEWEEGLGINYCNSNNDGGYTDEYNILSSVPNKVELSHHLAHAYSAASQCAFNKGMVVVMDGMGETWRTMQHALLNNDDTYVSDLNLCVDDDEIQFIPKDIEERAKTSYFDWREAESVYTFDKVDGKHLNIKPIFKRFTEENSPPTLYNHGFENMDSLGAVYSRASSHIFGDWNAW